MSIRKRKKKLFNSPISYNLERDNGSMTLDCIIYNDTHYQRSAETNWENLIQALSEHQDKYIWLNLYPLEDKKTLESIEQYFGIDPFLMADAVDFSQRSKLWETDKHLFCSFKMKKHDLHDTEHISFILGENVIISLQEIEEDVFQNIRTRMENNYGPIRKKSVDYLLFLLCDSIIDQYTLISDSSEDSLIMLEAEIASTNKNINLSSLYAVKKDLLQVHKDARVSSEIIEALITSEFFAISSFVTKLFTSISHNAKHSIDSLSRQLDQVNSLSDLYFAQQNNRLNDMIKLLTIMSAIFIPITFIAGFYGMNFMYMPETKVAWAYPAVISLMVFVVAFIILFFKRKKWL
jgi:magnesium transporter